MTIIDERTRKEVVKILDGMSGPVRLVTFTQEFECESCRHSRDLLDELAALSEKLEHQVFDFVPDAAVAAQYRVDKVPATVVTGPAGDRVRFYGVPAGYEFATLLEDIVAMSRVDSGLSSASREKLAELKKPVHLQVLVTPT